MWNRAFDVQSLAASCYTLVTGGKSPFCPYFLSQELPFVGIRGVTGPNDAQVNGLYHRTTDIETGATVYIKKVSGSDTSTRIHNIDGKFYIFLLPLEDSDILLIYDTDGLIEADLKKLTGFKKIQEKMTTRAVLVQFDTILNAKAAQAKAGLSALVVPRRPDSVWRVTNHSDIEKFNPATIEFEKQLSGEAFDYRREVALMQNLPLYPYQKVRLSASQPELSSFSTFVCVAFTDLND
jgi:hypothetical protein